MESRATNDLQAQLKKALRVKAGKKSNKFEYVVIGLGAIFFFLNLLNNESLEQKTKNVSVPTRKLALKRKLANNLRLQYYICTVGTWKRKKKYLQSFLITT
uniref:Uncharacterized protein n=1 Tax=Cacopsylla melanoneura TaxID=428564 RepID=A0A8D8RS19_9HEMI